MTTRGDRYDSNYESREAAGENVHGEADFVMSWAPVSVLDAGCGTGRVGRELARRGIRVVGVDVDAEMLQTARLKAPTLRWIHGDIAALDIEDQFDIVLMAGNVINFVDPQQRALAVANLSRLLVPQGLLIDGHTLRGDTAPVAHDAWAAAAGLELAGRWATWHRDPFQPSSDFAVTVYRKSREEVPES